MGTTRIKVIDLSSDQKEVKTSRKHARLASLAKRAEKLTGSPRFAGEAGAAKIKEEKKPSTAEITQIKTEDTKTLAGEHPRGEVEVSPGKHPGGEKREAKPSAPSAVAKTPHHRSKKYQDAAALIDKTRSYPQAEAIDLLYKTSTTKFDPTVELHLTVSDKNVKATVNFPHTFAQKTKELRYLVFADKTLADKKVIMADEKTIEKIESGLLKPKKDFDQVISTPKFMPQLAKIAKILGPVGMMPNPKNNTVTDDPAKVIAGSQTQTGTIIKTEPTAPIIHTKIGKLSKKPQELSDNLKALILAIGTDKIQKATLKSSMSPSIKLDVTSVGKTA